MSCSFMGYELDKLTPFVDGAFKREKLKMLCGVTGQTEYAFEL